MGQIWKSAKAIVVLVDGIKAFRQWDVGSVMEFSMRKVVLEEGPEVRGTSFVMRGKTEVGFGASLGRRA